MNRLARLLPLRQFGRLRHLRGIVPCAPIEASTTRPCATRWEPPPSDLAAALHSGALAPALPSLLPAFARVSLNSMLNSEPERRGPVRVYHGASRVIMVGTLSAVCRMIDRCIAAEQLGPQQTRFD
jgi:hypothetical protein